MSNERKQLEARETADTLIEERGVDNALAWADHCLTRTHDGFWRMVRNEIMRRAVMAKLEGR
jgi:hypothetical protein